MKKFLCKKHILLISWPLALICLFIARLNSSVAENVFANSISKFYLQLIGTITGLLPFSLAEFLVILVPLLFTFLVVRFIIKLFKTESGSRLVYSIKNILNLLSVCGIIFFMFIIGCGVNYYRYSFTYYTGYELQPSSVTELQDMCYSLAERAVTLREALPTEDERNVFCSEYSNRELAAKADEAYTLLSEKYEVLSGFYPKPKSVLFSNFMSRLCITGIFFPFTGEANVNVDISDYSIPSTMCHELAHLRGFMREDEANYIAYLACTASEDTEFNYSGTMLALIVSGNALYAQSPDMYYEVYATYSDAVKRDLVANSEYWDLYEDTVLSETAEKVNDTYLKMNDQADGVKSYGRMVDLLLAEYKKSEEN